MVMQYTEGRVSNVLAAAMGAEGQGIDNLLCDFHRVSQLDLPLDFSDVQVCYRGEGSIYQMVCMPNDEQLERLTSTSSAWLSLDARDLKPNLMMFSCVLQPMSSAAVEWHRTCDVLMSSLGESPRGAGYNAPFFCAVNTPHGLLASVNLSLIARGRRR